MARSLPSDATAERRRRILDAAEAVLRRHGPARTTVVDVAKALGQSHASLYRDFASKAELIDAMLRRWLEAVTAPLGAIAHDPGPIPAADRLRAWLLTLHRAKVRKVTADPEHFAAYHAIAQGAHAVVADHVGQLTGQIATIVAAGVASGEFAPTDPARTSVALLAATARFHHPALLVAGPPPTEEDLSDVVDLLLAGLRAGGS